MQDSKIKRETRRRKILDNSEKRLQKITRLKYNDDEVIPEHLVSPSDAFNLPKRMTNSDVADSSGSFIENNTASIETSTQHDAPNRSNLNSSSSSPVSKFVASKKKSTRIWEKLGFKLVILAVIVRIVHIFQLGYLFGETVVIPFSLFMMTQLGSCQFDQNIAGITGPVLLFIGVSPNKIKNLLICYNVVTSILIYFGIYFFTFVLVHLICVIIFGL